jgi:hypothetical protein
MVAVKNLHHISRSALFEVRQKSIQIEREHAQIAQQRCAPKQ